ncbi:MAG: nitric oxide synthase [Balneolaceae bacterium]|nr:MAG: nitric oxide synthase [Balneolaceae bacterium]
MITDLLLQRAGEFIRQFYSESNRGNPDQRLREIEEEIEKSGIYTHTSEELQFGAKIAWRNSNRCIGRIFHETLEVLDCRNLSSAGEVMNALEEHLIRAANGGNIQSVISVFQPRHPVTGKEIRIWNPKLIRYAGYRTESGIIGDPEEADFTQACMKLGWKGKGTSFDLLPVVIEMPGVEPVWFELPERCVLEVEMEHPEFEWFSKLGLKWYAVPVIADMVLEIGGLHYTAAPFNGWFMETEIGSRNFGDPHRLNMLPEVAARMGLDTKNDRTLWKDRAMLELNQAVLHSFRKAGVRIADHHTASRQFITFCRKEQAAGREVTADWSWIVPPMSGSSMEVFHQNWPNTVKTPNFYYNTPAWKSGSTPDSAKGCPFHISGRIRHQN